MENKETSSSSSNNNIVAGEENRHDHFSRKQGDVAYGRYLFRSWSMLASTSSSNGNQDDDETWQKQQQHVRQRSRTRWKPYDDRRSCLPQNELVAFQLTTIFRRLLELSNSSSSISRNSSSSIRLLADDDVIDMLRLCLYYWRNVAAVASSSSLPTIETTTPKATNDVDVLTDRDPVGETARTTTAKLVRRVENYFGDKESSQFKLGPQAYSMAINVMSEYARSQAALQYVIDTHDRLATHYNAQNQQQPTDIKSQQLDLPYYNSILHAFSKFSKYHPNRGPVLAEQVFDELCNHSNNLRPDNTAFVSLLRSWANSATSSRADTVASAHTNINTTGAERCEALLETMTRKHPELINERCINVCIDAFAKCKMPERAESILWRMVELSSNPSRDSMSISTCDNASVIYKQIQPTSASFDSALVAWSKSDRPDAATNTCRLFEQMRLNQSISIEPTGVSLASVLEACSKMTNYGAETEKVLNQFEEMYLQRDIQIPPNKYCYLHTIKAWSRTTDGISNDGTDESSPAQRAEELVRRMKYFASHDDTRKDLKPCVIIYTALIQVWARSQAPSAPERALTIFRTMKNHRMTNPNGRSLNAVITAFCRHNRVDEAYTLLLSHRLDVPRPDLSSYHVILKAYADAALSDPSTAYNAEDVLRELEDASLADQSLRPNVNTYNFAVKAWQNSLRDDAAEKAEAILFKMMLSGPTPETSTLNLILQTLARCNEGGTAEHAEYLLDRTNGMIEPDAATHLYLIRLWARSGRTSGPANAERHLEEVKRISVKDDSRCFKNKISSSHFNGVLESYSKVNGQVDFNRIQGIIKEIRHYNDLGFETRPDHRTIQHIILSLLAAENQGQMIPEDMFALMEDLVQNEKIRVDQGIISRSNLLQTDLTGSTVARKLSSSLLNHNSR